MSLQQIYEEYPTPPHEWEQIDSQKSEPSPSKKVKKTKGKKLKKPTMEENLEWLMHFQTQPQEQSGVFTD